MYIVLVIGLCCLIFSCFLYIENRKVKLVEFDNLKVGDRIYVEAGNCHGNWHIWTYVNYKDKNKITLEGFDLEINRNRYIEGIGPELNPYSIQYEFSKI